MRRTTRSSSTTMMLVSSKSKERPTPANRVYRDGPLTKEWTDGPPSNQMRLLLNALYARWKSQTPRPPRAAP